MTRSAGFRLAAFAAALGVAPGASAALDLPARARYVFQHVGDAEGFGTKTITSLHQDRIGFLWVGTQDGLYRYDGAAFVRLVPTDGVSRYVAGIVETPAGALWVVSGSQPARVEGPVLHVFPIPGAAIHGAAALAFDGRGRLYAGTDAGLLRFEVEGSRLVASPLPEGASGFKTEAVHAAPDGSLLFGSVRKLARLTFEGGVERVEALETSGLPDEEVEAILVDAEGTIWLRTARGLYRKTRVETSFARDAEGLPGPNDFGAPALDRSGELLVPTVLGLYFRSKGTWHRVSRAQGATSSAVTAATEDREGGLWLGYGGAGLDRWPGRRRFEAWAKDEGLPNEVVWAIARDTKGGLWVGTNDGLALWEKGTWRTWNEKDGLAGRTVREIRALADGSVVTLSVPGSALTRFAPGTHAPHLFPPLFDGDRPARIATTREGALLVDGRRHHVVATFEGARVTYTPLSLPAEIAPAASLVARPGGGYWLAGREGLAAFDGAAWRRVTTADGLRANAVGLLAVASRDDVWCAYREPLGLSHVTLEPAGVKVRHFTRADGLSSDGPFFLGVDAASRLYAGSDSGISVVSPDGTVRNLTQSDGLLWNDCSADAFLLESDGTVLVGTSRGLVRYDPAGDEPAGAPATVLTSVKLGGKTRMGVDGLEVPWSERLFEVSFAALTFRSRADVVYRYRLEGLETEPTETHEREARYPALPAGSYRFEVTSRAGTSALSPKAATFAFVVAPPWWGTTWFRLLLGTFVGLAAITTYRARVAHLERSRLHLADLVATRTRALDEKNRELSTTVEKLEEAQRTILSLQERAPGRLEDLPVWATRTAGEIASLVGAPEIGVFLLEGERVSPLSATEIPAPSRRDIEKAGGKPEERSSPAATLVPILGTTGDVHGALVVASRISGWEELQRQLLDTFLRHLATTLDLKAMRQRVLAADAQRSQTLEEMQARGIDTLKECPSCGRCYDQRAETCERDGASLKATRVLPYRVAGRYRLQRLLGEGGMGAVFRAEDEKLARRVALKIVRAEYLHNVAIRARFEREARLVARISHPGVVSLYDSGELPDGSAFLVMELLAGLDLGQVVDQYGPATPAQAARVARQVGEALSAAHAVGVIHRDLKPSNLFLAATTDGKLHVKVVDFGLAKAQGEKTKETRTGFIVGSPSYMSPEQIREQAVDGKSDLFSLASVLYELLCGRPAFDAPSVAEILTFILQRDPVPLTRRLPGLAQEVDDVFFEAFRKKHDQRPSLDDWIDRLVPALERAPSRVMGWPPSVTFSSGYIRLE